MLGMPAWSAAPMAPAPTVVSLAVGLGTTMGTRGRGKVDWG